MSTQSDLEIRAETRYTSGRKAWFLAAAAVFVASFVMPAVNSEVGRLYGAQCAYLTFVAAAPSGSVTAFASGMLNIVVIAFGALWMNDSARAVRRTLAWTALALIPLTGVALAQVNATPLAGYFTWIGSIVAVVSVDVWDEVKDQWIRRRK